MGSGLLGSQESPSIIDHPCLHLFWLRLFQFASRGAGYVEAATLTWAGILRIGESLQACRRDLVLPDDAAPGTSHALLRIKEPKTRGKHARHQAARIDPSDIVQLLEIAFKKLSDEEKL